MKKFLITGGAGFIGSNFVRYLVNNNRDGKVVILDALTYAGSLKNIEDLLSLPGKEFVNGDICDQNLVENILRKNEIDTIVHFAAETHVDRSILGPKAFVQTNVMGTFSLLEAARQTWLVEKILPVESTRFHHVSTDEVFGSLKPTDPSFSETTPYDPRSPYSASKASSDHLVSAYYHTYGLPITISNCSNNYGPYQFPEKLIPLMILNAIEGKPLPVYGDGKQIRDWLYVEDHCEAIFTILQKGKIGETYNIGGDNQPTNLEIIQTICDILDELQPKPSHQSYYSQLQHVTDRPGHDRRYSMNIQKIQKELGWTPKESLKSGLIKTVRWYLDHSEWISSIRESNSFQNWVEKNYEKR